MRWGENTMELASGVLEQHVLSAGVDSGGPTLQIPASPPRPHVSPQGSPSRVVAIFSYLVPVTSCTP